MTDFTNKQGTGNVYADNILAKKLHVDEVLSRDGSRQPQLIKFQEIDVPEVVGLYMNYALEYDYDIEGVEIGDYIQIFPLYNIINGLFVINVIATDKITLIIYNLRNDDLTLPAGKLKLGIWR